MNHPPSGTNHPSCGTNQLSCGTGVLARSLRVTGSEHRTTRESLLFHLTRIRLIY
jgi:hypothetical protein